MTALAILARKAELGKGKTRLARDIGAQATLKVYRYLIQKTASVAQKSGLATHVFFTPEPGDQNVWSPEYFDFEVQNQSTNLGDRIASALKETLDKGYESVLIIGTDCPYLSENNIVSAVEALKVNDAVIGPSDDGGFYMMGLKSVPKNLFDNIAWSTSTVFSKTKEAFDKQNWTYQILPQLADIDVREDWIKYLKHLEENGQDSLVLKDFSLDKPS